MPRIRSAWVAAAVVALLASACTGSSSGPAPGTKPGGPPVVGAAAAATPAAELRAELSHVLEEHIQLVTLATRTTSGQPNGLSPSAAAVRAALDLNSIAFSKVLGRFYPAVESPILAAWRQHIGYFLAYVGAKAASRTRDMAQARSDLDGFRTAFGLLVNSAVKGLPSGAVTAELSPYAKAMFTTIDAQVEGKTQQFESGRSAAGHMQSTAALLAAGMAGDLRLSGTDTPAADLRAGLTALMTRHVFAVGMAVDAVLSPKGSDDPLVASARRAADVTSAELSEAVGSAYPDGRKPFLESWRRYVGLTVDYAAAQAKGGDRARAARVRQDLMAYPRDFGELMHAIVTSLSAGSVSAALRPVVTDVIAAIDADVARRPQAVRELRSAAGRMRPLAATLAGGIAQHKRLT